MLDWEGKEHVCNFNKYEHVCKFRPTVRAGLYILVFFILCLSYQNSCQQDRMVEQLDRIEAHR